MLDRTDNTEHTRYRHSKRKETKYKCQRRARSHDIAHYGKLGKSLWAISLTSESKSPRDDNCLHSAWQASSWAVHFRLAYCGRLLAGVLQASFACTTGAGGASFTPSLNFRNIVAHHDSPAFALVSRVGYEDFDAEIVRKIFQNRQASPYDIDVNGNNLLHVSKSATLVDK